MIKMKRKTVDIVAEIFGKATVEILSGASGTEVYFAPTIQKIPSVHMKPDIGCFVQFQGDYYGLMIINFTKGAALDLYRNTMLYMGMPEDELAVDHTSDEVVDSIGEVVNQIIGNARLLIQNQYGLSAYNNQPKAICLMESVMLAIDSLVVRQNQCRRLSFKLGNQHLFHIELFIENTEFILMDPQRVRDPVRNIHLYDDDDDDDDEFDSSHSSVKNPHGQDLGAGVHVEDLFERNAGNQSNESSNDTRKKSRQPDFDALLNEQSGKNPNSTVGKSDTQPDIDALLEQNSDTAKKKKTPNDDIDIDALLEKNSPK